MLLLLVTIATLCLSGLTVSATSSISYSRTLSLGQSHTLNVPCRPCAFSRGPCAENKNGSASLAITFRTENDTLLANDDIIFPISPPMTFRAQYQEDSGSETVSVSYFLFTRGLYQLEMTLVDKRDRIMIESPVSIFILQRRDQKLVIIGVDSPQYTWDPYHLVGGSKAKDSWWSRKTGKSDPITSAKQAYQKALSRNKDFLQLIGPAILPALLGMAAGLLAVLFGFFVGCAMYYWYYELRRRRADDPEREVRIALAPEKS